MPFTPNINYDPDKYFEVSERVRNLYKNYSDPTSLEASYSVGNIITDAFPHISPKEARKRAPEIIEAYTGHDLDTKGAWEEFGKTFKAQSQYLGLSKDFSMAYMYSTDSEQFKERMAEIDEELASMPLMYRNDFKDMSVFTDLLVETGRLAPSLLPTVGIYVAGGLLSGVTGGASNIAARGAGAFYSAMMEAGGVAMGLHQLRDEEGNKLDPEDIRTAWVITAGGTGVLNLGTTQFETITKNAVTKLFSKKEVKDMVKSGSYRSWGLNLLRKKSMGMGSEALEESTEELIGMAASNYVTNNENVTEGTLFEGHSREDIIKAMKDTAIATAKGMILGGLPTEVVGAVVDYNATDTTLKRNANKYSGYDGDSYAVDSRMLSWPTAKAEQDFERFESPVPVIRVGDKFVVKDSKDAGKVKKVLRSGAQALNVHIQNDESATERIDVQASSQQANNIASRIEGAKVKNNQVVFSNDEEAKRRAQEFATSTPGLTSYKEQSDGSITLTREVDGVETEIEFVSEKKVPDVREPIGTEATEADSMPAEMESGESIMRPVSKRTFRRDYDRYKKDLKDKGASDEDVEVLNNRVLQPMYEAIKKKTPDISSEQAYEMAMPTSYFGYLASRLNGVSPKEFFDTHFSPESFIALTQNQEQEYLQSVEGQESISIEGNLQTQPEGSTPIVGGLVYRDQDGKMTIGLGSGYTPMTAVHEIGHVLVNTIKDNEAFAPFKRLYSQELKQDGGQIGNNFQERFTSDLELYIKEGKIRDEGTRTAFKRITEAIKDFIKYVNRSLDDNTRVAFDNLLDLNLQPDPGATAAGSIERTTPPTPQMELDLSEDPDAAADDFAQIGFNREPGNMNRGISDERDDLLQADDDLASIEYTIGLDGIKQSLKSGMYPDDRDLAVHAGDPDVDWEIQFRKIWTQDRTLADTMSEAYDQLQAELAEGIEIDNENQRIIEIVEESIPDEDKIDIGEEVGDTDRFMDRMKQQLQYTSIEQANDKFIKDLRNDDYVIEVSKKLTEGLDISQSSKISPYLFKLVNHKNPTTYAIRKAREALREGQTYYRQSLLTKERNFKQLSYEAAMFRSYLNNGNLQPFDNSEVRRILSSDADPVVKSLIRKNLASDNVLQTVVDDMNGRIDNYATELNTTRDQLETAFDQMDRDDAEYAQRNELYRRLQGINKNNRDKYNKIKKSVKVKRDALKARAAMERLIRRVDKTVGHSPNFDVRTMDTLKSFWEIMKSGAGKDRELSAYFKEYNLEHDTMPDVLKQFFEMRDDGIYFKKTMNRMTMTELEHLKNSMKALKDNARQSVVDRKSEQTARVSDTVMEYMSKALGIDEESFGQTMESYKDTKSEHLLGERDNQKGKFKARVETQFLTFSRIVDKIDPSGALKEWIFGKNGVDDILSIQEERKQERYKASEARMTELGLKMGDFKKEFQRFPRKGGDKVLTLDDAIGVYIYAKQPRALQKLLSVDGNGYKREEVAEIVSMVGQNESYVAWAEYLIEDMIGRHGAIAETFYKAQNKILGFTVNYFPLIRGAEDAKMIDMLEEEYYSMRQTPDHSMTFKSTGAVYALDTKATASWHRMVHKQEHYIASAQWVSDSQYMLRKNGGDLYSAVELSKGKYYAEALEDFIDRFAARRHVYDTADNLANHIRSNLVVARLGYNILTAMKQLPSLMYFAREMGPVRLVESLTQVLFNMKGVEQKIYSMAPRLQNRSFSHGYELVTSIEGEKRRQKVVKKIGTVGMTPIRFMDRLVVDTLWIGAYNSGLAKGMDSEQSARNATRFIGDTQVGGDVIDTAAIYSTNNTLVKYLLMFTSQLNKNFNMLYADIPTAFKQKQYKQAISYMIGLGLSMTGIMLVSGDFIDDEDDEDENTLIRRAIGQFLNQIPIAGNIMAAFVRDDYFPGSEMLIIPETHALIKAFQSDEKDEEKRQERINKNLARMGLSVSEVSGLPSGISRKIYNTFEKDDEINMGYMLNSAWADYLSNQ